MTHPTGNQFVRHLLDKLLRENRLALFATTLGFADPARWSKCLPAGLAAEIGRRSYRVPADRLATLAGREVIRLLAGKSGLRRIVQHEVGWASVDAVYQALDRRVATDLRKWANRLDIGAVYGYEDGCGNTFAAAKDLGLSRIYDLPIAYWETSGRLLREEAERWPDWEPTLGATSDSPTKLARKTRELELADLVVCPSDFVADSLPGWARMSKRVVVAPFGSPAPATDGGTINQTKLEKSGHPASSGQPKNPKLRTPNQEQGTKNQGEKQKLHVLFAGSMTQRKGLADVFAAMRLVKRSDVELVVMGTPLVPMAFYRRESPGFIHEPTRPHAEVLGLMRSCDVLVLPSIVEGRALVMQEAMSQGLPLIVTANTGGADLIVEGHTGFLVPMRSPEKIAEKFAWCADHRDRVKEMGQAARRKAAEYKWGSYGAIIAAAIG